jgi:hypothetical protein
MDATDEAVFAGAGNPIRIVWIMRDKDPLTIGIEIGVTPVVADQAV